MLQDEMLQKFLTNWLIAAAIIINIGCGNWSHVIIYCGSAVGYCTYIWHTICVVKLSQVSRMASAIPQLPLGQLLLQALRQHLLIRWVSQSVQAHTHKKQAENLCDAMTSGKAAIHWSASSWNIFLCSQLFCLLSPLQQSNCNLP